MSSKDLTIILEKFNGRLILKTLEFDFERTTRKWEKIQKSTIDSRKKISLRGVRLDRLSTAPLGWFLRVLSSKSRSVKGKSFDSARESLDFERFWLGWGSVTELMSWWVRTAMMGDLGWSEMILVFLIMSQVTIREMRSRVRSEKSSKLNINFVRLAG